jgi:hypothetical protein
MIRSFTKSLLVPSSRKKPKDGNHGYLPGIEELLVGEMFRVEILGAEDN